MKNVLTQTERAALLRHIEKALRTGHEWADETLHHPAGAMIAAVLSIPGVTKSASPDDADNTSGFVVNGWQWDWLQHFSHNGKQYRLSGSGYYGGHSFGLYDE